MFIGCAQALLSKNIFKSMLKASILFNACELIVAGVGPFATISCEPRQVRKEATVAADSGAEVWLVLATISLSALKPTLVSQAIIK